MPEEKLGHCWNCQRGLTRLDYGRELNCLDCQKPTRCCRNCRQYAPGRPNDCLEPRVERIVEKTRANFCEWFEPSPRLNAAAADAANPDQLRSAAEDLFKMH